MDVTGITPKGIETARRFETEYKAGKTIEEIAASEPGFDPLKVQILISIANKFGALN